jgi:hypothetical protein
MESDRMTSLADIESLLDDLVDELKHGGLEPEAALVPANELAEAVVGFVSALTVSPDPPPDMLDQVAEAVAFAQKGYAAVSERLPAESPEQETLGLLAGYWEMRTTAARLEASVVRNRSAVLAAVPAPETSSSPLQAKATTKAGAPPTTSDPAEVRSKSGLGPLGSDDRPEADLGDDPFRPGTIEDFGTREQAKHRVSGFRRPPSDVGIDKAATTGKGTDPLGRARKLGLYKAREGEESGDGR